MSRRAALLRAIAFMVLPAALVLGGLQILRWHAMGAPQREALALLEAEPPGRDGANAYPWLAAMDHEVPMDQVEEAMAADVLRHEAWAEKRLLQATSGGEPRLDRYIPFQDSGFGARARKALPRETCFDVANWPCLADVRSRLDEQKAVVAAESERLALLDRALAASHVTSPYGPGFWSPQLRLRGLHLEMTAAAVDAAEKRPAEAFARACRLLDWSRRMAAGSDDRLLRSDLRSFWASASSFLLELRREFPATDLPQPCDRALAPLHPGEFVSCAPEAKQLAAVMRGFGPVRDTPLGQWNPLVHLNRHLTDHPRLRAAWLAQELAQGCGATARQALASGSPLPPFAPVMQGLGLSCFAAMQTCAHFRPDRDPTPLGYRAWPHTVHQWGRLQLLAAGHSLADATREGGAPIPLPEIPGFPIEHDAPGKLLVIRLREDRKVTEFLVDIAGFVPPAPMPAE